MECQSCSEALTALLDGELSSDESRSVRDHLSGCPGCRSEFESLSFSAQLVERLTSLDPEQDLWARIQSDILPAAPRRRFAIPLLDQLFSRRWVPVSAIGGVLAIVLAFFLAGPADPVQDQFYNYVNQRDALSQRQRDILFNPETIYRDRQDRNPFAQPVSLTNTNPFQE